MLSLAVGGETVLFRKEPEAVRCYRGRLDIFLQFKSCSMGDTHRVLFRPSQITALPAAKSKQWKKARP